MNETCKSGSVMVMPNTTDENPFVLDQGYVTFRGERYLNFFDGFFGPVIAYKDQITIVKALNSAFKGGYTAGFDAPKFK